MANPSDTRSLRRMELSVLKVHSAILCAAVGCHEIGPWILYPYIPLVSQILLDPVQLAIRWSRLIQILLLHIHHSPLSSSMVPAIKKACLPPNWPHLAWPARLAPGCKGPEFTQIDTGASRGGIANSQLLLSPTTSANTSRWSTVCFTYRHVPIPSSSHVYHAEHSLMFTSTRKSSSYSRSSCITKTCTQHKGSKDFIRTWLCCFNGP